MSPKAQHLENNVLWDIDVFEQMIQICFICTTVIDIGQTMCVASSAPF